MNSLRGSEQIVLAAHDCRHCQQISITSAKPLDEQEFFFRYNEVLRAKNDGCDLFSTQISSLYRLLGKYAIYEHNQQLWHLKIRISSDKNKFHIIAFDWMANGKDLFDSDDIYGEEIELHVFALQGNFLNLLIGLNTECLMLDSLAVHYVTARPLNPSPKSVQTINLVRQWLDECCSRHAACRARESHFLLKICLAGLLQLAHQETLISA